MNPKVSIVILNWNNWKDTIECLESLYQINYPNYNIIIVDNGSEDESVSKIKEYCNGNIKVKSSFFEYNPNNKPIQVSEYIEGEIETNKPDKAFHGLPSNRKLILIKNHENYGFAKGNNIGMHFVLKNLDFNYILLLNNDTVVANDFLDNLIEVTENEREIGIVGPNVCYYDDPEKVTYIGGYVNISRGKMEYPYLNKVEKSSMMLEEMDYICGCSLLIKRKVIEDVGFLDPDYFLYYEDVDWCLRAKRKSYKIVYVPKARIWHKVSASIEDSSPMLFYYRNKNLFLLMKKNNDNKLTFLLYIPFIMVKLASSLHYLFKGENIKSRLSVEIIYDTIRGNYGFKKI